MYVTSSETWIFCTLFISDYAMCSYLQWLTDTFINFLHDWQHEADKMDNLKADEKRRLCLSPQTLEGLRLTGK